MIWNLTCRNVRRSLALWAGNDLDEADQASCRRHLAACPDCREEWQRLRSGQGALQALRASPVEPEPASIWPRVERHLQTGEVSPVVPWRGWLPTGTLAAACVAFAVIALPVLGPLGLEDTQRTSNLPIFSRVVAPPAGERLDHRPPPSAEWSVLDDLRSAVPVRTLLDGTNVRDL